MRVSSSSAQWQTAHAVAGHSGQFCDMAPLSGTRRAAEPILPHARSPVTPGTFATRFRWSRSVAHRVPQSLFTARTDARHSGDVCDQVPMARSRSSNYGAELTYGDEKNCDILRLSQSFLWKSDFYVENPIFKGYQSDFLCQEVGISVYCCVRIHGQPLNQFVYSVVIFSHRYLDRDCINVKTFVFLAV